MTFDIFISYKRRSVQMANNLYYRLTTRGYRVFFDLDEMRNDRFDEQIYNYIRNAKDIIVILEKESLNAIYDGSYNDDWFCREIIFALKEKKNIIPLLLDGYEMPSEKEFPDELKEFAYKNALHFGGLNYFEEYIHQLESKKYLSAAPVDRDNGKSVFKFFSKEDCKIFESGKLIGEIKGLSDEPFYYFVHRKGKYRFKSINNFTNHELIQTISIDEDTEEIVDLEWPERKLVSPENPDIDINPDDDFFEVKVGNFSFKMIKVEGGKLLLGATEEQKPYADSNEYPPHIAELETYYISEFPITQNLYEIVMGYNKSRFKETDETFKEAGILKTDILSHGLKQGVALESNKYILGSRFGVVIGAIAGNLINVIGNESAKRDKHVSDYAMAFHLPVEKVSLTDAQEFCRRLSQMTNLKFSLPSESEWEYAARGGKKSKGYIYAGSNDLTKVAWFKDNSNCKTHPVGLNEPNELGIYDMSGNVWEWTETRGYAYGSCCNNLNGDYYIRRGGSWWHEANNCRVSKRYMSDKNKKTSGLGFRIVLRVNES